MDKETRIKLLERRRQLYSECVEADIGRLPGIIDMLPILFQQQRLADVGTVFTAIQKLAAMSIETVGEYERLCKELDEVSRSPDQSSSSKPIM